MGTAPVGPTGPPERRRLTRADRLENREDTVKENLIRRWIRHEQATLEPNGYPEEGEIVIWIYRHNDDLLNDFAIHIWGSTAVTRGLPMESGLMLYRT